MSVRMILGSLALALVAAPAFAEGISFTVENLSGADLQEFYATPVGIEDWNANLLPGAISAGTAGVISITMPDGCDYDFRMVFADGDALEDVVNICSRQEYTIR